MLGVRLLLINTHYNSTRNNQKVAVTDKFHVALVLREEEDKTAALLEHDTVGWGGGEIRAI